MICATSGASAHGGSAVDDEDLSGRRFIACVATTASNWAGSLTLCSIGVAVRPGATAVTMAQFSTVTDIGGSLFGCRLRGQVGADVSTAAAEHDRLVAARAECHRDRVSDRSRAAGEDGDAFLACLEICWPFRVAVIPSRDELPPPCHENAQGGGVEGTVER